MLIVDVAEPIKNVWDTGQSEEFVLLGGSRLVFRAPLGGSLSGAWIVIAQYAHVVLVRRDPTWPAP